MARACRRCGQSYEVDDPLFVTCPPCRIRDAEVRTGCSRFTLRPTIRFVNTGKDRNTPGPGDGDNVRRAYEEDR